MKDTIQVSIERREGPEKTPYTQEYKVPLERGMSMLNVLDYISNNCDSTLAYEASCRRGLCSVCIIHVNGKVTKSCLELAQDDLVIKNASKYPLHDLTFTNQRKKK